METFSALLAICAGNSPAPGEFPAQRPVTRSFEVFFDLHLNKRLSKQSWGWWFETLSCPLWRHCNDLASSGTFFLTVSLSLLSLICLSDNRNNESNSEDNNKSDNCNYDKNDEDSNGNDSDDG